MIFYRALLYLVFAMAGFLVIGTIFALLRSSDAAPVFRLGRSPDAAPEFLQAPGDDIRVFSGIGRLRITLSNSSIMILTIAFPYSANDIAFTEELAARIGNFRTIASNYFSSLPADKLRNLDEDIAKQKILEQYNAILRLGRIEALYFSDLLVLE